MNNGCFRGTVSIGSICIRLTLRVVEPFQISFGEKIIVVIPVETVWIHIDVMIIPASIPAVIEAKSMTGVQM